MIANSQFFNISMWQLAAIVFAILLLLAVYQILRLQNKSVYLERKNKYLEKEQAMRTCINQAIIDSKNEQELLDSICKAVLDTGNYTLVWVGYGDQGAGKKVRPVAYSGLDDGYLESLKIRWTDSAMGRGPTGSAIRNKTAYVVNDIKSDPYFAPWREESLKRGYTSCAAIPLVSSDQAFGAFNVVASNSGAIEEGEINVLEELAVELSYHISLLRRQEKQKLIEKRLREDEKRLNAITTSVRASIIMLDENGVTTFWNPGAEKMFGYKSSEIIGRKLSDHIIPGRFHEGHLNGMLKLKNSAPDTYIGRKIETVAMKKNGKEFPVEISVSSLRSGDKWNVIGVVRDITSLKKTEEEGARLATAVEQAGEAILTTDAEGLITYVNPSFEKITGYSSSEVIGMNPRILKSGKHSKSFYRNLWRTIKSGKIWMGQFINVAKDGALFEEESTISPIISNTGEIKGYVAVKRDVTEMKRIEREMRRNQKLTSIGTLAGGIAHDFNNVLMPIMGYTELIKKELSKDSPAIDHIEEIIKAGKRAKDLVRQVLTFSHRSEQSFQPVELAPIVKEALKLLRASILSNITLEENIDSEPGVVLGDPTQIHQVIINLCANAAYAMKDCGGVLKIGLEQVVLNKAPLELSDTMTNQFMMLTVSDNGEGMYESTIEQIFDPFYSTKPDGEGSGMGLSVLHGIVKNHGGFIEVDSEPEKGSTFKVYFPRYIGALVTESSRDAPIHMGQGNALIVDDEDLVLKTLQIMLEHLGYKATLANGSDEAYSMFQSNPGFFDIVITDMTMPNQTGDMLAQRLHKIRKDIPVIVMTGFIDKVNVKEMKSLGISEIIAKPISPGELSHIIKRCMRARAN